MTRTLARHPIGRFAALTLTPSLALTVALAPAAAVSTGAARAQGLDAAPVSSRTVALDLARGAGGTRTLALPLGKSAVIDLPVDARDVMVTDHKVADVVLSTPRRIYVLGLTAGQTDATFVDGMGHQILRLNVRVDQDTSAVSQTLERILPGSGIRADAVNQSIILSGEVQSASDADKAIRIASSFVSTPDKIVNMMSVAQPEQVMLKVRIVEVNRQIIKQLGVNLNALIGTVGSAQFALANAASWGANGAFLGSASAGYALDTTTQPELTVPCTGGLTGSCKQIIKPGNNYYTDSTGKTQLIGNSNTATTGTTVGSNGLNKADAMIQAFEQVGLVRTLAEPNLTTVSGEAAKFLAGGEFPVPAGEDSTGRITVTFKEFGVGLGFTPVVLSKGRISLKISTEYSQLTNVGALTQGATTSVATSGTGSTTSSSPSYSVPGLTVRRAETVVELPSGGAMMIAGLMEHTTAEDIGSLPGLMQLPVLGALFRSRDFQQQETELVVIVTPYLVKAANPDQLQTPADGLQIADDLSTDLLGRLNKSFSKPSPPPPGQTYQGPFGYVVE